MLRPTRVLEKEVVKPSPTGLSPSAACFPNTFRLARRFVTSRSPCGSTYSKTHNPQRATTAVLTLFRFRLFPFRSPLLRESLRFLFLRLLRCFTSPGSSLIRGCLDCSRRVAPFGDLRITDRLRLPGAFRSLLRPSSAAGAKASTVCPLYLFLTFGSS